KIRREERYHVMHVTTWFERLAVGGESRQRLLAALEKLGPDAGSVLAPLPSPLALEMAGIVPERFAGLEDAWRESLNATFERLDIPGLTPTRAPERARSDHSEAFRWLHGEFTSVRRIDRSATW